MDTENKEEFSSNSKAQKDAPIIYTPKILYEIVEQGRSKTADNGKISNKKKKAKKSTKGKGEQIQKFVLDGIKVGVHKLDMYNSLQDKHLIYFFKNRKTINHLIQMKIVL